MANLSPVYNENQFDNQGNLLVGGMIYSYVAGSSTPLATYTSSDGSTPQTNPIILNARGEVDSPIWLTSGLSYKLRLFDSLGNFISEFDNVVGVGDASFTADQWIPTALSPTYISASQFSVPGDQTSILTVGRRVKINVTAGTVYGYITASVYNGSTLTTLTVFLDSGSLDTGIDSIQVGLLTPDNPSYPSFSDKFIELMNDVDKTKKLRFDLSSISANTTRTVTVPNKSGTMAMLDDITKDTGVIFDWPGTTAPSGALALPLVPTNISRTTYANLFAAIGTTWGVGDGSTTFGCPYQRADHARIAANANVATESAGQVNSHTHTITYGNTGAGVYPVGGVNNGSTSTAAIANTGGSSNFAAGQRYLACVWL